MAAADDDEDEEEEVVEEVEDAIPPTALALSQASSHIELSMFISCGATVPLRSKRRFKYSHSDSE